MEPGEDAAWSGLPGDPELDGLVLEGFLAAGGPDVVSNEVSYLEFLAATPNAGGGIKGQGFLLGLGTVDFGFAAGNDLAGEVLNFYFLKLPHFTFALAEAGFVLE